MEPGDAAPPVSLKLERPGLAPWARIGIGLCLAGMVGIGLIPPYEHLEYEFIDGPPRRIGTERKFVLSVTPTGKGIWRLDFGRLCIEEGVLIVCVAGLSVMGGRRKA